MSTEQLLTLITTILIATDMSSDRPQIGKAGPLQGRKRVEYYMWNAVDIMKQAMQPHYVEELDICRQNL